MSESSEKRRLDTVTPPYLPHSDAEMSSIGWAIFLGLLVLLLPLLPFLVIVWGIGKLMEYTQRRRGSAS